MGVYRPCEEKWPFRWHLGSDGAPMVPRTDARVWLHLLDHLRKAVLCAALSLLPVHARGLACTALLQSSASALLVPVPMLEAERALSMSAMYVEPFKTKGTELESIINRGCDTNDYINSIAIHMHPRLHIVLHVHASTDPWVQISLHVCIWAHILKLCLQYIHFVIHTYIHIYMILVAERTHTHGRTHTHTSNTLTHASYTYTSAYKDGLV